MEKKVALLGDSIRLYGYGRIVPKLLKGKAAVFQPKENCKFAKNLLRFLFDLKEDLKGCDVIHFNCGLWDVANIVGDGSLFSTDEEYAQNVLRIATALLKITPKVIFATTTPSGIFPSAAISFPSALPITGAASPTALTRSSFRNCKRSASKSTIYTRWSRRISPVISATTRST